MGHVTAGDWAKGIGLSVTASVIGGFSKLAIRKSWLMMKNSDFSQLPWHEREQQRVEQEQIDLNPESCYSLVETNSMRSTSNRSRFPSSSESENEDEYISNNAIHNTIPDIGLEFHTESSQASPVTLLHASNSKSVSHVKFGDSSRESSRQRLLVVSKSRMLRYCGMFGMTVLNPICCVWAMEFASPSILAPFSGLTLVWIIFFSGCMIQEPPSRSQIVASGWIIVGEVVVAIWGDHTNETGNVQSMDDIFQTYKSPGVVLYFLCLSLWITWISLVLVQSEKKTDLLYAAEGCKADKFAWFGVSNQAVQRLAWGVAGGSITGLQNFLKDALTIAKLSEETSHKTGLDLLFSLPPIFWIFGACQVFCSFSGLLLLTACMKRYDATYSSAMFVGSFVLSASAMAAARYHTFSHLESIWNYVLYPVGLLILLRGIHILATIGSLEDLHHKKDVVYTDENDEGNVSIPQEESCTSGTCPLTRNRSNGIRA